MSIKSHKAVPIVILVVAVIIAGVIGFKVVAGSSRDSSASDTVASPVEPKAVLDDYSWEELSQLADMIAAADSDDEALQIEEEYDLVDAGGQLTGATKSLTFSDGMVAQVQIVGFRHDVRSDGSGLAGITFIFKDCISWHSMCPTNDNADGWKSSSMRLYLNSGLLATLPSELQEKMVAVDKYTNNVGETDDLTSVSTTSDKLWLFSFVEVTGNVDSWWDEDDQEYASVLDAEGTQYQLFSDAGVVCPPDNAVGTSGYSVLAKSFAGVACWWWERSADNENSTRFNGINSDGSPNVHGADADTATGVVPGFCL
jgi:hypothetical protein